MEIDAKYLAFLISTIGGFFAVAAIMKLMRFTTGHKDKVLEWSVFWVGCTERAVAIALVIWAPKYVAAFIGAWIALKIAANWQREKNSAADWVLCLLSWGTSFHLPSPSEPVCLPTQTRLRFGRR